MGAATTIAGFAGIAWSDFPGVREIGVFAAVGVAGALAATRWLLPPLTPPAYATSLQAAGSAWLANLLDALERRWIWLSIPPIAALVLCSVGLPRLTWEDDVSELNAPLDAEWLAEDAAVRAKVGAFDTSRLIVALGTDDEHALQRNDSVHALLLEEVRKGSLVGFRSLHAFLWSAELQHRNWAALRGVADLPDAIETAFERQGFRAGAFEAFASAWNTEPPAPLRYADLSGSPLRMLAAPFRVDLGERIAILTFLRGVTDPESLSQSLSPLGDVHYFDQQRFVAELYGRYRRRTLQLLGIGGLAVFGLLLIRYRRPALALAALGPALLAGATTLSVISLFGAAINLLHLLGVLLVLCMGVDYAIFLLEGRAPRERAGVTLLSITIACASTCLAFGLLAASSFPALRALGVTTGIGVMLSLVFAPTALILSRRAR
jgi:predicted exporter